MSIDVYTPGTLVRLSVAFADAAGVAVDPGGVTFSARAPDGTPQEETYPAGNIVRASAGNYYVDLLVETPGRWHYRFAGIDTGQAADEHEFVVSPSRFD